MHKINKRNLILFLIFLPFLSSKKILANEKKPNLVVIWKKKRVLALYNRDELIKAYRIRLGFNPKGQKQKEGDGRTPEGKYFITHKNPYSKFFLSLGLNYPNQADRTRAAGKGNNPGSDIYIHGLGKKNIFLHKKILSESSVKIDDLFDFSNENLQEDSLNSLNSDNFNFCIECGIENINNVSDCFECKTDLRKDIYH